MKKTESIHKVSRFYKVVTNISIFISILGVIASLFVWIRYDFFLALKIAGTSIILFMLFKAIDESIAEVVAEELELDKKQSNLKKQIKEAE